MRSCDPAVNSSAVSGSCISIQPRLLTRLVGAVATRWLKTPFQPETGLGKEKPTPVNIHAFQGMYVCAEALAGRGNFARYEREGSAV